MGFLYEDTNADPWEYRQKDSFPSGRLSFQGLIRATPKRTPNSGDATTDQLIREMDDRIRRLTRIVQRSGQGM